MPEIVSAVSVGAHVSKDYEILGMAGAGGMGVVYRARDLRLGRTVALKFLPAELAASSSDKDRFLQEARTASALDHPNVGVIHGIEETADGRTFIVMAFYEGQSLAEKIRKGPIAPREAVEIAMQMACGLGEAHAQHIVHRDIKPSNVMLTSAGGVKIVDFGLAHVMSSRTASQVGAAGTISYMAPEQAGGKVVDQRADIWALGVVLTEMLTGQQPFDRGTLPATLMAILAEAPRGMEAVPPALQAIIYRALAKEPESRYRNSSELLHDLEAALPALNDKGTPVPPGPRRSRPSGEVRRAMEQASRSQWSPPARRRSPMPWILSGVAGVALLVALFFAVPLLRERLGGALSGSGEKHIAVLPFDNIGNSPENAALVQGLMDSLSGKLSNLDVGNKALWVVPASEVRRHRITDPGDAMKQLGANLVVKGAVERNGKDVHLEVNLIDAKNLRQIGFVDLSNPTGDLAALQNEAISRLAQFMHLPVSASALNRAGDSANPAAYQDYLTALGYMQRYDKPGNLDAAIAALRRGIQTDPQFALGYAQLAEAYRMKNQIVPDPKAVDQALEYATRALQLDQGIGSAYVTLGRIHAKQGKTDLAAQEFEHTLKLNPTDAQALEGIARNYESSGRITDAEQAFQRAVALRPDDWDTHDELGRFYLRQDKYSQAIAAFQKAVALTPDNAQALLNLGGACIDSGDTKLFSLAESSLKRSIELEPSYPAYANLGNLYLTQRRYPEAVTATQKALSLNSNDYLVWGNLVSAYQWLHQEEKAADARARMMPLVQQAVKQNPKDAVAQSTLASLYAQDKLNAKAKERLDTALALAPDDPNVLSNAAESFAAMGDRKQALEYIQKALKKGTPLDQIKADPLLQGAVNDPGFAAKAAK